MLAGLNGAFQDLQRQRIGQQLLNRPFQRPRAKRRIIAFAEQRLPGGRSQLQRDLALGQIFAQRLQLDVDDSGNFLLAQTPERNDVVDTVQELRFEVLPQRLANVGIR